VIIVLSVVATKLVVTSPMALDVRGIAQIGLSGGAHTGTAYPTSVVVTSPTVFTLDYAANVAVADVVHPTYRDATVRTKSGGYMVGFPSVLP